MAPKRTIIIKIGGRPASDIKSLDQLLTDIAQLISQGNMVVLVHGGGADVSELSRKLGIEPVFIQGKRVTSPAEMDIVDMGLAGLVNTRLLRRAQAAHMRAIGLSGVDSGLFLARSLDPANNNRTGAITSVDGTVLSDLSAAGYLPIVSSVSMDTDDMGGLNINADDAAMEIALERGANALIYLSDIPGILKDGTVISRIDQKTAEAEISSGVIGGGMIPKVRGSLAAVAKGVGSVIIGGFEQSGDLAAFLAGSKGTTVA